MSLPNNSGQNNLSNRPTTSVSYKITKRKTNVVGVE